MFRSLWCPIRHGSIVCTPRSASAASRSACSPRPAPETAARRDGPLQRPRSWCCDRNDSRAPMPLRRRRGRAARDARFKPADSLVPLRGIAAAATLRRLMRGCGAGAYGEQRSRRPCSPSRRRWPAGSTGVPSCAGGPRIAAQVRRRPGRVAAMAARGPPLGTAWMRGLRKGCKSAFKGRLSAPFRQRPSTRESRKYGETRNDS